MDEHKERDLFTVKKNKPQPRKGKKEDKKDDVDTPKHIIFGDEDDDDKNELVHLEPLTYATLMPGLVTLGRISHISKYDVTVSLPFMLYGRVSITKICKAYTSLLKEVTKSEEDTNEDEVFTLESLFKKGQYVVVKVDSVDKEENKHRVHLSLLPHEVNFGVSAFKLKEGATIQCAVASVEDNGYVMETGISSVQVAFLKRKNAEGSGIIGVGSIVQCIINKKKVSEDQNAVHLQLSAIPGKVNTAQVDLVYTEDLSMLLPGSYFSSTIIGIEKNCMKLVLAEKDGVISASHLKSPLDLFRVYKKGQKVNARVLYVTPVTKVVHLTLQNIIFNESRDNILHGIDIGEKKQAQVLNVEKKGVFFKIEDCRAFCLGKALWEGNKEKHEINPQTDYSVGSKHTIRVMDYHYFDETFVVTLQTSLMQDQALSYSAIKVGEILRATIKSYDNYGAKVSISPLVQGVIPKMHLTDVSVAHPEKKKAVGCSVIVRVLAVKADIQHLLLTSKKLLVKSEDPIISEYDEQFHNVITRGFIVKILPMGLVVAFYSSVKGFIPRSHTNIDPKEDLSNHFTVGNVVKCRIISVKPDEQKMTVSLFLERKEDDKAKKENEIKASKKEIDVVKKENYDDPIISEYDEKFIDVITRGSIVKILPMGLLVAFDNSVKGFIPRSHTNTDPERDLSDHFTVGNLVKCRIISVKPDQQRMTVSLFLERKGKNKAKKENNNKVSKREIDDPEKEKYEDPIISEYDARFHNVITRGSIVKILPRGLLLAFHNSVKGFIPRSHTNIDPKEDLSNHFTVGSVVKCIIISVKPDEQKMTASLFVEEKEKDAKKENEIKALKKSQMSLKSPNKQVSEYVCDSMVKIGSLVKCQISDINNDIITVTLDPYSDNKEAQIPCCHLSDYEKKQEELKKILSVGDSIKNALVFDNSNSIILTLKRSLFHMHGKVQQNFKIGETYTAVVKKVVPGGKVVSIRVDDTLQDFLIECKDLIVSEITEKSLVGETILITHSHFDHFNQPVFITNNESPVEHERKSEFCMQLLYDHLQNQKVWQKYLMREGCVSKEFGKIEVGNMLEMDIVAVKSQGMLLKHEDYELFGVVMKKHYEPSATYEEGLRIAVRVLHIHLEEKCLVLTAKKEMLDALHARRPSEVVDCFKTLEAEVLLTNNKFALVQITDQYPGLMAYMTPRDDLVLGQKVTVITCHVLDIVLVALSRKDPHTLMHSVPKISIHVTDEAIKNEYVYTKLDGKEVLKKIRRICQFSGERGEKRKKIDLRTDDTEKIVNGKKKKKLESKNDATNETVGEKNENELKSKCDVTDQIDREKKLKIKNEATNETVGEKKKSKLKSKNDAKNEILGEKKKKKKIKSEATNKCVGENGELKINVDAANETDGEKKKLKRKSAATIKELLNTSTSYKPCLKLTTGFLWDVPEASPNNEEDQSSDDEDYENEGKKKKMRRLSKVERELLAKEEEKRLHELESARLEKKRLPQTALDYEELLQESPNSSAIWIQFISFHLENAEVDKARAVAKRALQVINVQEFEERINVWTVMLRLEVLYGTEESLEAVFGEALATNDPLKIYFAMALVYAESNKIKEAEEIYFKMSKKFSMKFDVWIKAGIFFFRNNKLEEGRKYMDRALLSLDKSLHVDLIKRFAELEFNFGEFERARTMFESLLSNYPKRMDMWIVYVDLLVKKGDVEGSRQVLERMTSLKLRLSQMRAVFKKFLEFENAHGTPLSVEAVKNRVQDYVAASLQQE